MQIFSFILGFMPLMQGALKYPKEWFSKLVYQVVDLLTRPIWRDSPSDVTDCRSLKTRLLRGDVLLVCGNARISYVVKVLTLSPWSHVVLYVGDERERLTEEEREFWRKQFGSQCLEHLVIDADPVKGVHLKPLDDYVGLMMRHCRAEALDLDDTELVCQHALRELGKEYDVGHILRLSIFFTFPWELLPEGVRKFITDFTLSEHTQICSRVLSEAFQSVGYPINPAEIVHKRSDLHNRALGAAFGLKSRGKSVAKLIAGGRFKKAFNRLSDSRYTEIHMRSLRHVTPADYDLSRFFSVIKDPNDLTLDYRNARTICKL